MAKKPKVKAKPKSESPQLKRLRTRVKNLESKLSGSVPRGELEALKRDLDAQVSALREELAASVPRTEADALRARIGELEERLAGSVPKGQLEKANRKVDDLEARNQELAARNGELEPQVGDLRSRIKSLETGEASQAREIEAVKGRAAEADMRGRETVRSIEAVANRARYRKDDGGYWLRNEDWQELRGLIAPVTGGTSPGGEHKFDVSGKCAACGMTERYLEEAVSILQTWPEDSEKKERMAELRRCKGELGVRRQVIQEPAASAESETDEPAPDLD
ncbi:MAG: hypothetical protein JRN23_02295 [Nitrososphaerota archaeon]|nr:hypothetical protein [Nitrososphaerota archaeon]